MEITWLGHSCFRLKGSRGTVITDPYVPNIGYNIGKPTARVVTLSHSHPDHCNSQGVGGEPKIVSRVGEYEISEIQILGINTFHDAEQGAQRGKNIIYLIHIDEISICHLGDLGHVLTNAQAEQLDNIDVLLVPVGGVTTIDAVVASQTVRQLEPKIVIPMHYKTPVLRIPHEFDTVDRFLKEMGVSNIVPQPKLNVSRSNIPETLQVTVLDYPQAGAPA